MGTVPSPYVPVAGDDATQARVLTWADAANWLIGNATSGGSKRPVALLRQGVVQSIPNATDTAITFDVEEFDYDNGHSTVTSTDLYTAQTPGLYLFIYTVAFASNVTGLRKAYLQKNGANGEAFAISAAINGDATTLNGGRALSLTAGDTVHVMANQNSTAALNTVITATQKSVLSVYMLSV